MHVHRTRQTGFFTIVPNMTARDHALSFTARGLLAYLLSLPDGAREDVKTLANKSVEGRSAVSRALNELEARGYLARTASRDVAGRIRTQVDVFDSRDGASAPSEPATVAPGTGSPGLGKSGSYPEESGYEDSLPPQHTAEDPGSSEASEGRAGGEPSRALSLLAKLGRDDPRLHLSGAEAAKLAPLVEAWLTRGATTNHVTSSLTSGLPARVHQAAALVRYRLTTKIPAEGQFESLRPVRHECSECRAPIPNSGTCRECDGDAVHQLPSPLTSFGRTGMVLVRAQLKRPGLAVA